MQGHTLFQAMRPLHNDVLLASKVIVAKYEALEEMNSRMLYELFVREGYNDARASAAKDTRDRLAAVYCSHCMWDV